MEHRDPFAHADEAVPSVAVITGDGRLELGALPVVADLEVDGVGAELDGHARGAGVRVPQGIGERFFHDAIDREFHTGSERASLTSDVE